MRCWVKFGETTASGTMSYGEKNKTKFRPQETKSESGRQVKYICEEALYYMV